MKRLLSITLMTLVAVLAVSAQQYKYEVGPTLGLTGYLGESNNGMLFKHPGFTLGGLFRYNHNSRWAFKTNLNYGHLIGDTKDDLSQYPDGANHKVSSHVIDLGVTAEFNFLNFGRGPAYKKYKPISPYMVAGAGFAIAICNGVHDSFILPIGVGVKYKFKEKINLGFEFTMRKEFNDRIDGLSDLYDIPHSFAKNTDWYSFAMFTASFEFGKRCIKCNYIE